jgi:hypothetical protein
MQKYSVMYIVAMMEVLFAQFAKKRFEVMLHCALCAKNTQKVLGATQSLLLMYCFLRIVR